MSKATYFSESWPEHGRLIRYGVATGEVPTLGVGHRWGRWNNDLGEVIDGYLNGVDVIEAGACWAYLGTDSVNPATPQL